jgi:prepilin-type N-terminal cleavage/methylation domain-containing protein
MYKNNNFQMINKRGNKNTTAKPVSGFTLLETLVALAIFSIVVTISVGSVVQILGINRQSQSMKIVMNNLNMALENMTIDMRFGSHYWCDSPNNIAPADGEGGSDGNSCSSITFQGRQDPSFEDNGLPIKYSLSSNQIIRSVYNSGWVENPITPLVSSGLKIDKLTFYVSGAEQSSLYAPGPDKQPKVVIVIQGTGGSNISGSNKNTTSFNVETTVSQRSPKNY